jgi:hypothetical protein
MLPCCLVVTGLKEEKEPAARLQSADTDSAFFVSGRPMDMMTMLVSSVRLLVRDTPIIAPLVLPLLVCILVVKPFVALVHKVKAS